MLDIKWGAAMISVPHVFHRGAKRKSHPRTRFQWTNRLQRSPREDKRQAGKINRNCPFIWSTNYGLTCALPIPIALITAKGLFSVRCPSACTHFSVSEGDNIITGVHLEISLIGCQSSIIITAIYHFTPSNCL